MPEPRPLLLRVLYTINNGSYILARSPAPVPVTFINEDAPVDHPYATVSFKKCLEAICRSSPEYMQDRAKDYSVYVLDPLETNAVPAPLDISNLAGGRSSETAADGTAGQSRGVAVGMGLMSLALSVDEKDSLTVVGTLGKTGTGQDALEVILALRETPSMDQTRQSTSSRSWNNQQTNGHSQSTNELPCAETLATIASIQNRTKAKTKPKKPPRVSSTPVTQSDQLLSADTYIGPIRKKGRPKAQTNANAAIKSEQSTAAVSHNQLVPLQASISNVGIGTSTTTTTQSTPDITPPSSQTSDTSDPPPSDGFDFAALAALFSSSQSDAARNGFLLNALSLIDSSNSQEEGAQTPVHPVLVDALRRLVSTTYTNAQAGSAPIPATSPTPALPPQIISSLTPVNNDEVIILDKENVNPTTYNRRSGEPELSKLGGSDARSNSSSAEPVPQNRGLGGRFIENSTLKSTTAPAPLSGQSLNGKKRSLDDCMEERDNKRNKHHRSKGKERGRSEKKEPPRFLSQQQNNENGFKYYPRLIPNSLSRPEPGSISYYRTPVETWTSPVRPQKQTGDHQSQASDPLGGSSLNTPIVIPDSPQAPRVTASSPIRPTSGAKKPYVVPAWARTDTALQPRLSETAQRAIDAAEEKKKEERRANRRRTNAAAQDRYRQKEKMANEETQEASHWETDTPSQSPEFMQPPPLPVMPKSDLPPIIASSDADLILFPSINQRAQSPPPAYTTIPLPPVTPQRPSKVASSTPGGADFDEDSLFTPLSIARRSTHTGGSPLFSPGTCGSPLARKKHKVISPAAYRIAARQPGSDSSTITVKVSETSEITWRQSQSPALDMDDSQEELDCPPSSLPIASSDNEIEDTTTTEKISNTDDTTTDNDPDEEDLSPHKQHWVGLPPSSPPPPTSPCLIPIDDEGEPPVGDIGEELPIASETDEPEEEVDEDSMVEVGDSDWAPSPNDAEDMTITQPINTAENPASDTFEPEREEDMDEMALLRQFTTFGSSDSLSELDAQEDTQETPSMSEDEFKSLFIDNGMDLNGFLESFKLMQDGSLPLPDGTDPLPGFDLSALEGISNEEAQSQSMDHTKIAADLQAILSGCVV